MVQVIRMSEVDLAVKVVPIVDQVDLVITTDLDQNCVPMLHQLKHFWTEVVH